MLPEQLSNIFRARQKSYKMVLILSIIEAYKETQVAHASLDQIAQKFLKYYQHQSNEGNIVDSPPEQKASGWNEFSLGQTKTLLKTPIEALSSVLHFNQVDQSLTFANADWFNEDTLTDLQNYALQELNNYNEKLKLNSVLHSREELTSDKEPNPVTLTVKEQLEQVKSYIHHKGFLYPDGLMENFYLSLKSKPFVILAGVSGTGKTKLVKLFAEALGATMDNGQFTLIPVRPDWSDPSDLLGYKDLAGVFRPGRLTEVLVEALKPENKDKPYFICLDEMNLARVEYYFSDILSVMETQEWNGDRIITSPLIGSESLREEDRPLYGGVSLPDNVYVIGTVNMDETTHPFSKKVLDRANTIEFNYINLQQYPDYDEEELFSSPKANNLFLRSDFLQLSDMYSTYRELVHSTTDKLVRINNILEEIHSHVGFRIRDSICFYMVYNQRFNLLPIDMAFDGQLLQKILPRIQGSSLSVKRVLLQLMQEALGKSIPIKDLLDDASELYLKYGRKQQDVDVKYPQSARKIAFMLRRLEEDGFTSYWLS
ncbi:McrB family protein [Paenibacillus sp. Marseille-Q7038]